MTQVTRWWALTLITCALLTGCGLTQTVTDGTVSLTKSIFYKKIKTLHLDFTPRAAINADGAQTPLATMVRVYQLKDRKAVDAADYQTLLRNADTVLKDDMLVTKELLVMPKGCVTLNVPMDEDAQFVAVVGLFNRPDIQDNRWRLVLSREDLDPDKPRTIELGDGWLNLVPLKE
ncbi:MULTISPECIES: type VI secretion system lipoprotein TssJ [Enterobacter]|jgi:type VI secretion system protein VasD|uniref:type VI secretion system lipoprotein TssJ n=1 Tax=Enterobacter TaxID=547 RepID=UPI000B49A722|nr:MULTISPECIES: type VI secretion system lipoprotein TssJ [Enterobacter]EHN8825901.1 type VI secretion system lipoprotein TssJ [Enterobacter bugandensis]EHN8844139.1 type VI secretion system lipoprotein TssJ [Enterobacter bugandensis]MBE3492052.1 type VI secretion system lipoprotein TssJ [Enterobacter cloacae complex sp. P12RS]MBF2746987.1 type VI secretion system lipoprotein TssJ [Enterobacter bugandensis]MBF2799632.1 type VI secretion system lipoprotein TssJ [Enterobacter bugandensis]